MRGRTGFTLIETLITTLLLVTGLAAVAAVFSYGVQSTTRVRHQTAAAALLYTRMEELRTARDLRPGHYSEFVSIPPEGEYLRSWEITSEMPRRVTVIIYAKQTGRGVRYLELARATTLVAPEF